MSRPNRLDYSLRVLGGKLGGQWERDRRDTLFLLGAVLLAALPQLPALPGWIGAVFLMLFVWRLGLVLSGRWLPRASVRVVASIACTAGVFAQYQTLIGREAGIAMLVLFLGLKLMEMQARRDLFVAIFLCFFMLLTGFFHSQSLWMGAASLLAVFGLVTAMLTMQFGQQEAPIGRRLRIVGSLLVQALPVAALLFVVFPRLQTPLWGQPGEGTGASTGLSRTMSPGTVGKLASSREIAMRVRFDGTVPDRRRLYWRGPTLATFDGQTWRELELPDEGSPVAPRIEFGRGADPIDYAITLEPQGEQWLLALDMPARIAPPFDTLAQLTAEFGLEANEPVTERVRYRLRSYLDYKAGRNESVRSLAPYLELPPGSNPRARALAASWAQQGENVAGLIDRMLLFFREEPFRYTLNPPILGRETVDDFLFRTRAGFCEHYSSAFVVMMRAMGIPARVVTGYQGGEQGLDGSYWIVRQADAHAWAEVWIRDRGWIRVDPTAAVAPERVERGSRLAPISDGRRTGNALLGRFALRLDWVTNAWNEWVLTYDGRRQRRFLSALGLGFESWQEVAGLLAGVLLLVLGGCALLTLHPKTPRDPVERAWSEFCDKLAAHGLTRQLHETAWQLLERANRVLEPDAALSARRIVERYNRLRFDPRPIPPQGVRNFQRFVRRFRP